jgi:hypothetical protein
VVVVEGADARADSDVISTSTVMARASDAAPA